MNPEKDYTIRGFGIYRFKDSYGVDCNIQLSSSVEPRIWIGCKDMDIKIGYPWTKISEEEIKQKFHCQEVLANTRMHLNVEQVKAILPILQRFVETEDI